ncbi:hypothetical protein ACFTSF_11315 [Kribbella sp. NPDC056951]|uniref:hypothetical protein n=1 Tax=Kribbella sp. NPDC056951 TaxID=3345978 RepID=UPI00363A3C83
MDHEFGGAMKSGEYKILQWDGAFDGQWSDGAVEKYRREGFDGVSLTAGAGEKLRDLGFLQDLPGLRYLDVLAKVKDDLDAFRIGTLEALTLATGSRGKVPQVIQEQLRALCLTDRPGIAVRDKWPILERLRLGAWRGSDLELLRGAEHLSSVHLEGRRQEGTLAGIDGCVSLTEFTSINYSVEDSAPLRNLAELRTVKLMSAPPGPPHRRILLSDLAGGKLEKIWISNADELVDVGVLHSLPQLREVRLIHCRLREADQRALDSLSAVNVKVIDPRAS